MFAALNLASSTSLSASADAFSSLKNIFRGFLAFNMAGKEATVYILDLGAPMGERRHGRNVTDMELAVEYIWEKITTTVSAHTEEEDTNTDCFRLRQEGRQP